MVVTERTFSPTLLWTLALGVAVLAAACGDDPVPVPTTIAVSPSSAMLESLGETVQLTATVKDQDGQTMPDVTVTWTSGNESAATVNSAGLVTATGNGAATMEASVEDVEGTAQVTVEQRPAEVLVSPEAETLLSFGEELQLSAEALDANGHMIEGADFTWSSDDESVATVDGAGVVTAVGNGAATVEASAAEVAGASEITVEQRVAQLTVSPGAAILAGLGDTVRFQAEAADAFGNVIEGVEFTWSSNDESIATVDPAGLVTATGNGIAEVEAATEMLAVAAIVRVELHRRPLLEFFEAMGGSNWNNNQNWGMDAPLDTWHGVRTNVAGSVTRLDLQSNNLTGSLSRRD